jgi:O-antigen/teichoic acid export membrane protein
LWSRVIVATSRRCSPTSGPRVSARDRLGDVLRDATRSEPANRRPRRIAAIGLLARQAGRRMGWGVADQGMSSLTNFAVNIYIARELGVATYGAFALAYVTYHFALNASRGLATDPLLVRFSGTEEPIWRRAVASSTGTAAVTGVVTGLMVLLVTPVLGGSTRLAFLALGVTLPGLLLQDSWRFAFFAHGRGALALLNDTVWAIALVAGLAVLRTTGNESVFWVVLAWGASAAVGAVLGPLQARVLPRVSQTRRWLSTHWDLAPRYLAEGTTNSAAAQLVSYGIGLLLGLAALGAVQAASLVMGPYMVVLWGISLVLMPEAVRVQRESQRRLWHLCMITSVVFSVLAAVWGAALLIALPIGLGEALLGNVWRAAYPLVLPTTMYVIACVALGGAGLGLRALGAARRSLRATVVTSVTYVVFSVVGAACAGVIGAVSCGAAGMTVGAIVFWRELSIALREPPAIPSRVDPDAEQARAPRWTRARWRRAGWTRARWRRAGWTRA